LSSLVTEVHIHIYELTFLGLAIQCTCFAGLITVVIRWSVQVLEFLILSVKPSYCQKFFSTPYFKSPSFSKALKHSQRWQWRILSPRRHGMWSGASLCLLGLFLHTEAGAVLSLRNTDKLPSAGTYCSSSATCVSLWARVTWGTKASEQTQPFDPLQRILLHWLTATFVPIGAAPKRGASFSFVESQTHYFVTFWNI
jgi:hypothetical protein